MMVNKPINILKYEFKMNLVNHTKKKAIKKILQMNMKKITVMIIMKAQPQTNSTFFIKI